MLSYKNFLDKLLVQHDFFEAARCGDVYILSNLFRVNKVGLTALELLSLADVLNLPPVYTSKNSSIDGENEVQLKVVGQFLDLEEL